MNFFKKIKDSIYSPEFYKSLPGTTLSSALKYFFLLMLVLVGLQVLSAAPVLLIGFQGKVKSGISSVVETYPADLEITLKSNQVSINQEEPYFINDKNGYKLVVFDSQTPYSVEKFKDYGAYVWVTKDTVFYESDSEGQIKSQSLSDVPDTTVTKSAVDSLVAKVNPWLPYLGGLLVTLMFVGFYFASVFNLIYFLFLALLVWLLAKVMKKGFTYKQSYIVSIYASTLAFLVSTVWFYTGVNTIPFLFTLISLGVVFVNLRSNRNPA